jgi:hypothetical protein
MIITREQYKEAKLLVRDYERQNGGPKRQISQARKKNRLRDVELSTRLMKSISYYFKRPMELEYVHSLKDIRLQRFASLEGVGASQVRELKELCSAAGVKMKE